MNSIAYHEGPTSRQITWDRFEADRGARHSTVEERETFAEELVTRFDLAAGRKQKLRQIIFRLIEFEEDDWVFVGSRVLSRSELAQREKAVRVAGEALVKLPAPYQDYFGGIGKHLLREADAIKEGIPGAKRRGRPVEWKKLEVVKRFYDSMTRAGIGATPPSLPDKLQIEVAQAVYEFITKDHSSLKNWQTLVRDNFLDYCGDGFMPTLLKERKEKGK